jgi:hypothetical protein
MKNNLEAESKRVRGRTKSDRPKVRRDPTLTGGEKMETEEERADRKRRKSERKEPPIIQKEVT